MADTQFPDFMSAPDTLAGEDTTLLHEANQHHQNLTRNYPHSFPQYDPGSMNIATRS